MELIINEKTVLFSLQEEKNAGDILKSVHNWLGSEGWGIQNVQLNGNDILYRYAWNLEPVSSINVMQIEASPLKDLRKASLEALLDWAKDTHETIELLSRREGSIAHILENMGLYDKLGSAFGFLCEYDPAPHRMLDSETRRNMDRHIAELTRDDGSFNADELPAFAMAVYNLVVVCNDRLRELDNPSDELRKTALLAHSMITDLGEIGILLQTGKERDAFTRIFTLTEILAKVFRLFWLIGTDPELKNSVDSAALIAWNEKTRSKLQEMSDAMNQQDHVLLGDLLEYEISPAVEELLKLIPEIGA